MAGDKRGGRFELGLFALPAAPLFALGLPLGIFLPPYYASHLGLPLAAVSAVFVSARLFDLLIDPMIGSLQDRTKASIGRRRFWLSLGAPALMLFTWYAFIGIAPNSPAFMASLAVFGLYAAYATMSIAHLSWAGEIRPDYHGRTAALGAVQFAGLVGQIAMLALAAYVVQSGMGDDGAAVHVMGWTVFCAIPICVGLCVFFVRERDLPPQPHLPLREAWSAIAANVNLRRVLWPDLLTGIAAGIQGGLFLFFFQHVLEFWRESQTLLFIFFVAGLAGAPFWIWLGRRIGKHRALQVASLYGAGTTAIVPFLPAGNFPVVAGLMLLGGAATAASGILLRAMMADVVDEDELATGARRTGLFFGLMLTTNKIGLVMGPLTYVFLDMAGFDAAPNAANSDTAIFVLTIIFVGAPVLLNLITAWALRHYPLDEARQAEVRAQIDARATP